MLRVTASKENKSVTLIVAEDAFNYIRPALTKEQQDALLSEVVIKLLNNQESEKDTLYLKTILFTNSRRDNATAYLAHESTDNFNKPKMYRFTLEGIDNAALHPYWPTVTRNVSSRDIVDAPAKFSAMTAPVFNSICSQDCPPIQRGDNIIRINRPTDADTHTELQRIWLRDHENDNARAFAAADIVTGDTQQTLVDVKNQACQNIQAPLQAFIAQQKIQDESAVKSLQTYRAAICDSLQNSLDEQLALADKSIGTDTQQINELSNPVNAAVNNYLHAKYEYAAICKPLAAALHDAAKKYYISRWSVPTNRGNKINLEKERAIFNTIFKGIAQINEDFSLSPVEDTIKLFSRKSIPELQELLTNVLNMSYTKTNPNDAFHFLHSELIKFNGEAHQAQGQYFTPFIRHTGLKAASNHVFTFLPAFIDKQQTYQTCKTIVSKIPATQLQTIAAEIDSSKSRIKFAVTQIASEAGVKLAIAEDNISKFSTLINKQQEFRDQIDVLTEQLRTMREKAEPLTLNLEPLQALNLPPQVAKDLTAHLNPTRIEETRDAIFGTIEELQQDIMREQRSLTELVAEAKTTAETLKPLDVDKEIVAITHVLQSTQERIEATNGMITETEEALRQRVQILENLQAVMTALQCINDLKTRLHALDPSTEQFVTLAQTADQLFNNAADAFKQIDTQENKFPGSLIQHLAGLKERLENDKHDTADILRCHFLLSGLLNFEYWEKHVSRSKKKGLVIDENNHNHTIHRDIINLIAIAKKDEFANWNTNADTARALLNEFSLYQTTSKNKAVNLFLTIANEHKYTLTTVSMDPEHHNSHTPGMFPNPESSPLINPARLQAIQPIGKNGFFKRHPRVKTALIIGGIVLGAAAIGVGVFFAVTYLLPATIVTALTAGIMTLINTGTFAPIVTGIVMAFAGIGALIGRAVGKRQAAKRAAKHEAQNRQEQITDEQIARDMENIERMVAGFGDSEEVAPERQLTQPLVPPAVDKKKSVPAATGSNPFGEREETNPFAPAVRLSQKNMFTAVAPREPNQLATAAAFKEACIRKCLALRKENGTLPKNFDIEPMVTAAKSIPGYFNEMITKNDFGAAVKAVLSTPKYAEFDVNLITDNPKFKQLVDHKQQALAKREQAADFRSGF